jgi:hypothetical protein
MGMEEIREEAARVGLRHGPCTRYRLTLVEEILDERIGAPEGNWVERELLEMRGGDRHIAGVCAAIRDELMEDYEADKPHARVKTQTISFTSVADR